MSDSIVDFIMEKIYAEPIRPGGNYDWYMASQRDEMKGLVDKVIRYEFDVVEVLTDGWFKRRVKELLEDIEPELLADPEIAAWYREWASEQRATENDDYASDNPRDQAATGTSTETLNRR